jgi:DNA modification methylase
LTNPIKKEIIVGGCRLLCGDSLQVLKELPDESIDCAVTSPPYWGLRDYGVDGQLGLEPSLGEHLDTMVLLFEEVKRVLKPTGTLWVNYGDCYATHPNGRSAADTKAVGKDDRTFRDKPFSTVGPVSKSKRMERGSGRWGGGNNAAHGVMKPKDLCMVPNRFAIAMQEAGWWVRSEIIWAKPNPMPESSDDRPATAHEKIFMFVKSGSTQLWRAKDTREWSKDPDHSERIPRPTEDDPDATTNRWKSFNYFYDADAVRQTQAESTGPRLAQDIKNQNGSTRGHGGGKVMKAVGRKDKQRGHSRRHAVFNERWDKMSKEEQQENGRNLRNYEPAPVEVWNIATAAFSEAHFATFPPELAKRCIEAGCPKDGVVLDPFGGAGTTGLVASQLQRKSILIELNPEYLEIAAKRIEADAPLIHAIDEKEPKPVQESLL